ncbi:cupin domain-containing protein [Balneolaceae bacterium YR4-1]|uniref:Cupin domain-containing protein n=1 Tax=Halalkalibaculum roseum TaxID=2709311 RepID=A0A6M1SX56_9BACT|nr:cupin domain-containing protein [Halalkalibaculum roseum]NGP75127.1 cupin domain-containing protein [Halalkalibaculum roseum]
MNRTIQISIAFLVIAALIFTLTACNQQSENMNQNEAATEASPVEQNEQYSISTYDPAMDLTVIGADNVEILGDTLGIKMYIGRMEPGDSVGWHFHPDHTVYVIEGGTLDVYFKGGDKQTMELPTGVGFVSSSLTDAAINTGNTTIKLLTHDIYRPRN